MVMLVEALVGRLEQVLETLKVIIMPGYFTILLVLI
jgi:hypothetical protein